MIIVRRCEERGSPTDPHCRLTPCRAHHQEAGMSAVDTCES